MGIITNKITKLELLKIDKSFRADIPTRYHYSITFDGIDEVLIVNDLDNPLTSQMVGHHISYNLNENNEITQFDLI
jgi:hypothetical protein